MPFNFLPLQKPDCSLYCLSVQFTILLKKSLKWFPVIVCWQRITKIQCQKSPWSTCKEVLLMGSFIFLQNQFALFRVLYKHRVYYGCLRTYKTYLFEHNKIQFLELRSTIIRIQKITEKRTYNISFLGKVSNTSKKKVALIFLSRLK